MDQDKNTINVHVLEQVCKLLTPDKLFDPVKSKHLLDKLLIEHFNMVFPEKIFLGTVSRWIRTNTPPYEHLIDEEEFGIVIPFLPSLKNLLQTQSAREY